MTNENARASIIGLFHGSAVSQPNRPRLPRSRPAISTEAQMVKLSVPERDNSNQSFKAAVVL
jgi:hypothetical protein